jgi:hypothetical protein
MPRLSRAVCLPSSCDPYRTNIWIECYKKFLQSDVDKLYVCLNSNARQDLIDYCATRFEEVGAVLVKPLQPSPRPYLGAHFNPDLPMRMLFEAVQEDILLSMEEDLYILQPVANQWFDLIENRGYNAVDAFRWCATFSLKDEVVRAFNLSGVYKDAPFFCQAPFVIRTADILGVKDRIYGSWGAPAGTFIPELNYTTTEPVCGDVGTWSTISLYTNGIRNNYVVPLWNWCSCMIEGRTNMPWIHTGGGCALYSGYLINSNGNTVGDSGPLEQLVPIHPYPRFRGSGTRESYHGFWKFALDYFPIPVNSSVADFNQEMKEALEYAESHLLMIDGSLALTQNGIELQKQFFRRVFHPII